MKPGTRKSGIDVIGDVPWGTHFGLFYKNKQDLIDVLVPYFKAGLLDNEFCMWVTAEPLNAEEAKACMDKAMPDFNVYVDKGQIEIIPFTEWYKINGVFDPERVLNGWVEKLRKARERGFSGLRATGNMFWLEPGAWKDFIGYEQTINDVIGQYDMLGVCSYYLEKCDANDILDVVSTHTFTLTRRNGEWKIIEDQGQKNARKALQESEERFRVIYDRAAMGIGISNKEGQIQDCNNAFQAMLGYSKDELRQMYFADITYPDDISKNVDLFKQSVAGQIDRYQMEKRYVRKDGSLIWCHLTVSIITDTNGDFKYSLAIIDDITERKRAEEDLRRSEERFRRYFEMPLIGFAITSPEKGWVSANDKICEMLGYTRNELMQMTWDNLTHPDDIQTDVDYFNKLLSGEIDNYSLDKRFIRKNGDIIYTTISIGCVRKPDGTIDYIVGLMQDITERKRAEEDLKSAKLQAELYLDLMGHDINNMHQIALGYLELARDMLANEEQAMFLDKPVEMLQRSAKLISNVRKLQKLHDGVFQPRDVDLCQMLLDVQREFGTVPDKTIKLSLNGFERCHVCANELLHDVFSNLVGNAIKHTGDRAAIIVDLDIVEDNGGRYCRVAVEDDGPGIPDGFKAKIFNRALEGTAKAKGMGLGLYLVKSLVDSYGGKVWVDDRLQGNRTKGARFVVMLPAAD